MTLAGSSGRLSIISPTPSLPYDAEVEYVIKDENNFGYVQTNVFGEVQVNILASIDVLETSKESIPIITCMDNQDGNFIGAVNADDKNMFWGVSGAKGGYSSVLAQDIDKLVYSDVFFINSNVNGYIGEDKISFKKAIIEKDYEWCVFGGKKVVAEQKCLIAHIDLIDVKNQSMLAEIIPVRIGEDGYLYDTISGKILKGNLKYPLKPGPDKKQ